MWSLPDINALNARAKAQAPSLEQAARIGLLNADRHTFKSQRALWSFVRAKLTPEARQLFDLLDPRQRSLLGTAHEHELRELAPSVWPAVDDQGLKIDGLTAYLGEPMPCEWHDHDSPSRCSGEARHYLVYDIFSDDPKEILTLCEHHDGYYGSPSEGYFTCADCGRVMAENYTWETYNVIVDDEELCLPCAAKHYIADDDNWIALTAENIAAVDFDRVRRAQHVIGVEMPLPQGIAFVDNLEFDSYTNRQISGDGVQEVLTRAMQDGHKRALLILDAGYQFAVSIGVYVDAAKQPRGKVA